MRQSATAGLMRRINRSAVLELVRESSPIARSQIARKLNMSLPTVMRIVDDLMEEDLVCLQGMGVSTGGRPSSLLEFNGKAYAVVGVDLGGSKMFGTVADLSGTIQAELYQPHTDGNSPQDYLDELCQFIQSLLDVRRPPGQRIRGIGVGVPGLTLVPQGVITLAPSLGWYDVPLQQILTERFDMPVLVENDVNLTALGEWGFGAGRGARNLVSIAIGTGIGAGIIISGEIYRGQNQAAGEVGYLLPGVEYLGRRYAGFGALESLASGTGVAERAAQLLKESNLPIPADGLDAHTVFEAARAGQTWAEQVVSDTVNYLSLAVVSIGALLDPEVIILGGGVARSADMLIEPIQKRVEGVMPFVPRLVASTLGRRAAAMGAIMLVLNATTEYFVVKRLS